MPYVKWMRRWVGASLCIIVVMLAVVGSAQDVTKMKMRMKQRPKMGTIPIVGPIPEEVMLFPDLAYRDGDNKSWRLDLAMPTEPGDEPLPALVIIHGGGWRAGDKRQPAFFRLAIDFAARGYVCVTVNYRLTQEAKLPACIEDVKCAVRWLRAHAQEYNVDPNRIGAYGNSAGAHLAAMLGLCPASAGLEGDGPWQEYSSMVQAVVASATPTNFLTLRQHQRGPDNELQPVDKESDRFPGPKEKLDEQKRQSSPATYVSADAPPFLLIHGTADTTVDVSQVDELVKALKEAGATDVTYMRFEGSGHGAFRENIDETVPAMEKFFERTLKKASP